MPKQKIVRLSALVALLFVATPTVAQQPNDFAVASQAHDSAYQAGDYQKSLALSTQLMTIARANGGEASVPFIVAEIVHGADLIALGRYDDAEPALRHAEKTAISTLGAQHQFVLLARQNLSGLLVQQGRYREAEPMIRENLTAMIVAKGESSPESLMVMSTLASVVQLQGRLSEAEPIHAKVDAIAKALIGENDAQIIPYLSNHAAVLADLGRRDEAEPLARKALDLAVATYGERHPTTITALNNLATILDGAGRQAEGSALLRRALAQRIAVLGEGHPDTLTSYNNLAQNLTDQGKLGEAEPLLRKVIALGAAKLGADHPYVLDATATLAQNLSQQGFLPEAQKLARQALAARMAKVGADNPMTLASMETLAAILVSQDKRDEAEALLTKVTTRRAEVLGPTALETLMSANNLAMVMQTQAQRAPLAIVPSRIAASGLRQRLALTGFTPRDAAMMQREAGKYRSIFESLAYSTWVSALVHKDQEPALREEAFGALQDAMAGTTSRAVALMAARNIAGQSGAELAGVALEREALSDQLNSLETAQTATLGDTGAETIARRAALVGQQDQLKTQLSRIDARLRAQAPAYYALTRPAALRLAEAQALLKPDEAAIMIVPTAFGTQIVTLTHESTAWRQADMRRKELQDRVAALRAGLDPQSAANGASFDRKVAFGLYEALIKPSLTQLSGKTHLFVVADGPLSSLPLSVLVTAPPTGSDDDAAAMRATSWFADSFALIQLPSLQSLKFLRAIKPSTAASDWSFQGYGNPVLGGSGIVRGKGVMGRRNVASVLSTVQTRDGGLLADVSKLNELPGLPGTAVELDGIRAALRAPAASLHLQASATETAIKAQDLSKTAIIAFATHGLLAGEVKGAAEPGLVLTPPRVASEEDDGLLSASEIAALKLNADMIILSACNSGGGDGIGTPALSGMARAFFYAGARSLLVSHWSVYDDVAPRITNDLIALRRADTNLSKAQALQRAMRTIREDTRDDGLAFPSAWAPFVMVGEAAR